MSLWILLAVVICFFLISTARKQRSCDELKFIPASYQCLILLLTVQYCAHLKRTPPSHLKKQNKVVLIVVCGCLLELETAKKQCAVPGGAVEPQGSCFTSSCHPSGCPHALSLLLSARLIALWVGSRAGGAGCPCLQDYGIVLLLFTSTFLGMRTGAVS